MTDQARHPADLPMRVFVHYDPATGFIAQAALSNMASERPGYDVARLADAVDVASVDVHSLPATYRVDLATVEKGICSLIELLPDAPPAPLDVPLADLQAMLSAQVDSGAGRERAKYITVTDGQDLVYEAKRIEAMRWREAGQPAETNAADYPWAAARAERIGSSPAAVLAEWGARADAWVVIGIAIEGAREGAKDAISAASTADEAHAAAQVTWPGLPAE